MSKELESNILSNDALNNFEYKVYRNLTDNRFKEVRITYPFENKKVYLFVNYPEFTCKDNNAAISKAKEYVNTINQNGELKKYSSNFVKGKTYKFKTKLNFGDFISNDKYTNVKSIAPAFALGSEAA